MYLYNETVGIDASIETEWLAWAKNVYIPEVLKTNLFVDSKIYKVLHDSEDGSISYSIQFFSSSLDQVVQYLEVFAPVLVEQQRKKFNHKHVAFRTLLEEVK
jgi:Domain of unknown function (DUF4286)